MRFLIDWDTLFDFAASRRLDSAMAGVAAALGALGFGLVIAPTIAAFFLQVPQ